MVVDDEDPDRPTDPRPAGQRVAGRVAGHRPATGSIASDPRPWSGGGPAVAAAGTAAGTGALPASGRVAATTVPPSGPEPISSSPPTSAARSYIARVPDPDRSGADPGSVVGDLDGQRVAAAGEGQGAAPGVGVADGVRDGLDHDPVGGDLDRGRQPAEGTGLDRDDRAARPADRRKLLTERIDEPERIEPRRSELPGHRPDLAQGAAQVGPDLVEQRPDRRRIGGRLGPRPVDLEPERGERRPEAVMEVPSQAHPLLLAGGHDPAPARREQVDLEQPVADHREGEGDDHGDREDRNRAAGQEGVVEEDDREAREEERGAGRHGQRQGEDPDLRPARAGRAPIAGRDRGQDRDPHRRHDQGDQRPEPVEPVEDRAGHQRRHRGPGAERDERCCMDQPDAIRPPGEPRRPDRVDRQQVDQASPEHEVRERRDAERVQERRPAEQVGRLEARLPGHDVGRVAAHADEQEPDRRRLRPAQDEDQGHDQRAGAEDHEPERRAAEPAREVVRHGDRVGLGRAVAPDADLDRGADRMGGEEPRRPERVRRPLGQRPAIEADDDVAVTERRTGGQRPDRDPVGRPRPAIGRDEQPVRGDEEAAQDHRRGRDQRRPADDDRQGRGSRRAALGGSRPEDRPSAIAAASAPGPCPGDEIERLYGLGRVR